MEPEKEVLGLRVYSRQVRSTGDSPGLQVASEAEGSSFVGLSP